jgi:toxin ParE1/3/4
VAQIVWTRPSIDHVDEIRRFVARDSERYADQVMDRIRESVSRLEMFPFSGRELSELPGSGLREVIATPYRVVYRYFQEQNIVAIVAVVHGSRSLSGDIC